MNIENIIDILEESFKDLADTLRKKNSDYTGGEKSNDPFANFQASQVLGVDPIIGILIRVMDKIQRIRSFANDGSLKVSNETVDDAFNDIIGYIILAKAMIRERREK